MNDPQFHSYAIGLEIGLAVITILALVFVVAPYGRHERAGWGPTVKAVVGWVVMESPAVLAFSFFFFTGDRASDPVALVLLAMWMCHYVNRTFVYPFRLSAKGRRMPALVVALAIAFNVLNAFVNGRWIGHFGAYDYAWLVDPRFLVGAALFFGGWFGNLHSDAVLRRLRRPGDTGYHVPRGGLFEYVSAPNYLCEIVEWIGWAIATWSFAGLAFAIYTIANLAPRALAHHKWYRAKFDDYPARRRALIPGLW